MVGSSDFGAIVSGFFSISSGWRSTFFPSCSVCRSNLSALVRLVAIPIPSLVNYFARLVQQGAVTQRTERCLASQSGLQESILNPCQFDGYAAFFVIVRNVVDPSTDGIAPHQPSIVGPQQFGRRNHVRHP